MKQKHKKNKCWFSHRWYDTGKRFKKYGRWLIDGRIFKVKIYYIEECFDCGIKRKKFYNLWKQNKDDLYNYWNG